MINNISAEPSNTIRQSFKHYFRDFLASVRSIANELSEEEFWTNPYPYGNSVGHLVLHITGNLNYYIGAQLGSTGYVRDREQEFTDSRQLPKANTVRQLEQAVETVITVLSQQKDTDWSTSYSAEGVDDVHDRFSIFLRCAVHFHHHIGHMSYVRDEFVQRKGASKDS